MKSSTCVNLCLLVTLNQVPIFFQLLRKGMLIDVEPGLSITELLCGKFGIQADYLEREVQTIFLDGKPVDDINSAIIKSRSTLALSAAMPGVVGVSLRKGGYYAPLRKQISYDRETLSDSGGSKKMVMKCFNTVASDLGPKLLDNGVWIAGKDFQDLLDKRLGDIKAGLEKVTLDDQEGEPVILEKVDWKEKTIFLQVKARPTT